MKTKVVKETLNEIDNHSKLGDYSTKFERLFQQAANAGIEFYILEDLINQALHQVDWEYAAEQTEKYPTEEEEYDFK